jgi:hypothetical protein
MVHLTFPDTCQIMKKPLSDLMSGVRTGGCAEARDEVAPLPPGFVERVLGVASRARAARSARWNRTCRIGAAASVLVAGLATAADRSPKTDQAAISFLEMEAEVPARLLNWE